MGNSTIVAEGATADAHETTITFADPTADHAITIPAAAGTVVLNGTASKDYGAGAADWTLTAAEAQASYITATNANGAVNAILPAAIPGKVYTVYNNTGQILTFKVTGGAGGTIANGKHAVYVGGATDVVEVFEQG
jgi:hypothetical protein